MLKVAMQTHAQKMHEGPKFRICANYLFSDIDVCSMINESTYHGKVSITCRIMKRSPTVLQVSTACGNRSGWQPVC